MMIDNQNMIYVLGGGGAATLLVLIAAFSGSSEEDLDRRMSRVGPQGSIRKVNTHDRQNAVKRSKDSGIPLLDQFVKLLPNPDKMRPRLARTGHSLSLGEYLLINALCTLIFFLLFH